MQREYTRIRFSAFAAHWDRSRSTGICLETPCRWNVRPAGVFETTHGLFAVADELRDAGDAQPAERTVSVRCVGYRIQFVVVGEAEAVACLYAGEDIASGVGGRGAVVARYGDAIDFYRGHVVMVSVVAAVVVISPVVEETVVVGWECRHVEVTELVKVEHVVAVLFLTAVSLSAPFWKKE